MSDRAIARAATHTTPPPRRRTRIQLAASPKKPRLPIDWPIGWPGVREWVGVVFAWIAFAGAAACLGGLLIGLPVVAVLGINMGVAVPWLMGITLGGLGVFLSCVFTSGWLFGVFPLD